MSEARIEALSEEFIDIECDAIVLSETWREEPDETLVLNSGHTFYGSGGYKGRCGVGFLVHRRYSRAPFKPIGPRLAFLALVFGSQQLRIFGVRCPDSSYSDDDVECVYEEIDEWIQKTKQQHLHYLIAGDFNAQVGKRDEHDNLPVCMAMVHGTVEAIA